jgi:GAF domain-containing protein
MATDIQTIRHLQQENIRLRSENNSLKKYVERLQRALRALSSLQHSISQIDNTTNAYNLVNQVLQYALDAVDSENGSLSLLDEEKGDLVFVTVIGETREKLLNYRLPKGQGVSHWAIKTQKTILVEDARREPVISPLGNNLADQKALTLICVPLLDGKRPLGAIEVVNTRNGRPFNQGDKEVLILIGQLAALAIVSAERAQP